MSRKVIISEAQLGSIIAQEGGEPLLEYLDKNLMNPLHKYLKRTRKKYDLPGFRKLYYDYEIGKAPYITARQAFQNPEIFKGGWVLHFTNAPLRILSDGFRGIKSEYLEQLWRTYKRGFETDAEGYCFAFDANDEIPSNCVDYGDYALMFRVSGLKVTNLGDLGQKQVIFNSKTANLKDCYIIKPEIKEGNYYYGDGDVGSSKIPGGASVINPNNKKVIYRGKNLEDAIRWVETNYRQYSGANAFRAVGKIQNRYNVYWDYVNQIVNWCQENIEGGCVTDTNNYGDDTNTEIIFKGPIPWDKLIPFYSGIKAKLEGIAEISFGDTDTWGAGVWIDKTLGSNRRSFEMTHKLMDELKSIFIKYKQE